MAAPTRLARVNELIRQQLAELLHAEVELPKGVLATITHVETSVDLRHTTVSISVLPQRFQPSTMRKLLTRLNALQRLLNRKLSMRPVPRIRFVPDKGEQHASRIEQLLAKNAEERKHLPS